MLLPSRRSGTICSHKYFQLPVLGYCCSLGLILGQFCLVPLSSRELKKVLRKTLVKTSKLQAVDVTYH